MAPNFLPRLPFSEERWFRCLVDSAKIPVRGLRARRLGLPKAIKEWSLRIVQIKLIKIGGRPVRHARRLVFQLAEVAVPRALFQAVLDRIGRLCPAP